MPHHRTQALSVIAEATDEAQAEWAWVIHRQPDRMLILRSRPNYADCFQALEAGRTVATDIGRRLGIPIATKAFSDIPG